MKDWSRAVQFLILYTVVRELEYLQSTDLPVVADEVSTPPTPPRLSGLSGEIGSTGNHRTALSLSRFGRSLPPATEFPYHQHPPFLLRAFSA